MNQVNKELLAACKKLLEMVEKITPIEGYPYGMGIMNEAYQIGVCAVNKAKKKK